VFAKACELGFEGMVSKREGGFYRCGRSRNWLKAKFDMTGVGALSPRRPNRRP
jgi:ATP-dependent DNA ligase